MVSPAPVDAGKSMLEIGRITRAHGVGGEVGVKLTTNRTERLDPGSVLSTPLGDLTVVAARPRNDSWLVRFAEITDRSRAEEMRGLVLSAEPIHDPGELWVHHLVGATVVDTEGVDRGPVTKVIANPASDLLELDSGALVPVRFVVSHEPGVRIVVDAPSGLFDLDGPAGAGPPAGGCDESESGGCDSGVGGAGLGDAGVGDAGVGDSDAGDS